MTLYPRSSYKAKAGKGSKILMLRQEIKTLQSRYLDQSLMYPGKYVFTWALLCKTWVLISIIPVLEKEDEKGS